MTRVASQIQIDVDGVVVRTTAGTTIAAAMMNSGSLVLRQSRLGESRGALCGMGVCQECRVIVDGLAHQRACTTLVAAGMKVRRGG